MDPERRDRERFHKMFPTARGILFATGMGRYASYSPYKDFCGEIPGSLSFRGDPYGVVSRCHVGGTLVPEKASIWDFRHAHASVQSALEIG